jgi:hypothetical protein
VFKIDTKEDALVYNLVVDDIQNSQFNCLLPPLLKGAKQYGLLYLAVKRCKGCRKILLSGTLKASAGNNELRPN